MEKTERDRTIEELEHCLKNEIPTCTSCVHGAEKIMLTCRPLIEKTIRLLKAEKEG